MKYDATRIVLGALVVGFTLSVFAVGTRLNSMDAVLQDLQKDKIVQTRAKEIISDMDSGFAHYSIYKHNDTYPLNYKDVERAYKEGYIDAVRKEAENGN